MLLTTQVAFVKMLLKLCISSVHGIFGSILKKVSFWVDRPKKVLFRTGVTESVRSEKKHAETERTAKENVTTPVSVNYHFTRKCNYKCGFCFHTAKTSFVLPIEEATRGLQLLKEAGEFFFFCLSYINSVPCVTQQKKYIRA